MVGPALRLMERKAGCVWPDGAKPSESEVEDIVKKVITTLQGRSNAQGDKIDVVASSWRMRFMFIDEEKTLTVNMNGSDVESTSENVCYHVGCYRMKRISDISDILDISDISE